MSEPSESENPYPKMDETRQGLTVDAGIASIVERVIDLGLTPRASCSGLNRDHACDTETSPYLSVQVAPTFETAHPTTKFPSEHLEIPLIQRFQRAGERANWVIGDGVSWMLYPTVTFRLSPTRGEMKNQLFGRDCDFDDLSEEEEDRLDYRYDESTAEVAALSDSELETKWDDLLQELSREFRQIDVPRFNDNREEFRTAQEEWPEVFEMFFDEDYELLKFYER